MVCGVALMTWGSTSGTAQSINYANWMSHLSDERWLTSISIPGAHDAATGHRLYAPAGFGRTQTLTIPELWNSGVRAFDLRPAVCDTILYIYHGVFKTELTFCEALQLLVEKLQAYPEEFAIVLLREELEAENDVERNLWPKKVGEAIASLGDRAVRFNRNLRLGDVRGKILFLSRNAYTNANKGAIVSGWSHSSDGTTNASITAVDGADTAKLQVQDYYALVGAKKQRLKKETVCRFLDYASKAPKGAWTLNFLSGYSTCWLGIPSMATSAGYKRNAATIHSAIAEVLLEKGSSLGALGILLMDYVGADTTKGSWTHWCRFHTQGNVLLQRIIAHNWRYEPIFVGHMAD